MKLVITSYRLGEISGGFGETGFLDIPPPCQCERSVLRTLCP